MAYSFFFFFLACKGLLTIENILFTEMSHCLGHLFMNFANRLFLLSFKKHFVALHHYMYDLTKTEISIKYVFTTETYQYCILRCPAYRNPSVMKSSLTYSC